MKRQFFLWIVNNMTKGLRPSGLAFRYARDQWMKELLFWKAVTYLKLVRDVISVLDLLEDAMAQGGVVSLDTPDPNGSANRHRLLKFHLAPLKEVRDVLEDCVSALVSAGTCQCM